MLRKTLPALLLVAGSALAQDVNDATEKAMKDAAAKVAPSVVRIETSGGAEAIWGAGRKGPEVMFRRGVGASTGLVVDPAGYILTSTFNFVGKPTDIFVTVPGHPRTVAKVIGSDPTRMLTMLKIDQTGLPVPPAFPKKEIEVGMWSIAIGRTLNPDLAQPPSINGGIISATNRIWGKAVQSDAKISPVNYGGPLLAIDGRVMGVIVPISPSSDGETAGFEWYDVGIGFAVPFEDVLKVVPKLKEGTPDKPVTLKAGLLGVTFREPDHYTPGCTIDTVAPETPADKAKLRPGDNIVEVDGKPILNQAQLFHQLRPKYEGEMVSLKVKRGDKVEEFKELKLAAVQSSFDAGFLGVLLMRDDPEPGAEVRFVYPNSPAARVGLAAGDRIMKVGPRPAGGAAPKPKEPKLPKRPGMPDEPPTGPRAFSGRDQFMAIMQNFRAGTALILEVKKKDGKTQTVEPVLGQFTDDIPAELPEPSTKEQALVAPKPADGAPGTPPDVKKKADPKKDEKKEEAKKEEKKDEKEKSKTGLQKIENVGAAQRKFWVFVPDTYKPEVSHGLIVWLHPAGRDGRDADDMVKIWEPYCEKYNLIMIGPTAGSPTGWVAGEADAVMDDVRWVRTRYTIDGKRVIAHGIGVGGQMAYYLGINQRDVIRGAVPVGAVLASNPKDPVSNQRVEFLVIAGAKDPLVNEIREAPKKLGEKKYKAVYLEMKQSGKEYVNDDPEVFGQMVRWMDTLDKQ
ncbi:MAG TPA: PDZ domain-containing protein [Gemmataceae bacterium]|nr:PDZ domain-containing protein [Gemmataceae bacterium]